MKIKLSSRYTPYTIDTYGTFTSDDDIDRICEREECGYDDIDWEYDMLGYCQALSDNRLELLRENILDDVIIDIKKDGDVYMPQYYNYGGDEVSNIYVVNKKALQDFISKNKDDYGKNRIESCDGFLWLGDENTTMLEYYINKVSEKKYSKEEYFFAQVEDVYFDEFVKYKKI